MAALRRLWHDASSSRLIWPQALRGEALAGRVDECYRVVALLAEGHWWMRRESRYSHECMLLKALSLSSVPCGLR